VSQSTLLNTLESHVLDNASVLPEPADAGETRNAAASAATITAVISGARRQELFFMWVSPLIVLRRATSDS
jgi:hypothetical protein